MPKHKDLKRFVRARMEKTGESYTTARSVLVRRAETKLPEAAPRDQWPTLAGMSDEAVKAKTGRTWSEWVTELDGAGAHELAHRDIARHLNQTYDEVSAWWVQTLTVGYERIRGLRDVGQRRGGNYDANKSRTYPVPIATLYRMFAEAPRRRKWLPDGFTRVRTSTKNKSLRADWSDDTQVNFYFTEKSPTKSTVAVQHTKLPTKEEATRAKQEWQTRLDTLKSILTE